MAGEEAWKFSAINHTKAKKKKQSIRKEIKKDKISLELLKNRRNTTSMEVFCRE